MKRKLTVVVGVGGIAVLAFVIGVPLAMLAVVVSGGIQTGLGDVGISSCTITEASGTVEDLGSDQVENARILIAVGKEAGVPPRGWVIAIATALQESGLRNLDYGDRDSLGLMQQRPSAGWGSPAEVTDPEYAARAFYGGSDSPTSNGGLLSIKGWRDMPVWQAAQRVQRSAFPLAYRRHEALATKLVRELSGSTAGCEPLQSGRWNSPLTVSFKLTSGFGRRVSPTTGAAEAHTGQDFAVPAGTPVRATSGGVVYFVGWAGGYGNLVRVRHAKDVETFYAHLASIDVEKGEHVEPGTVLGSAGSTGNSTGPHLHLEVRVDGKPTDPLPWLRRRGATP